MPQRKHRDHSVIIAVNSDNHGDDTSTDDGKKLQTETCRWEERAGSARTLIVPC